MKFKICIAVAKPWGAKKPSSYLSELATSSSSASWKRILTVGMRITFFFLLNSLPLHWQFAQVALTLIDCMKILVSSGFLLEIRECSDPSSSILTYLISSPSFEADKNECQKLVASTDQKGKILLKAALKWNTTVFERVFDGLLRFCDMILNWKGFRDTHNFSLNFKAT